MYYNAPLLYEQAYSITINNAEAPLYYFFDYDERSYNINMEFQHFHQFYEVHILLDGKASHIIEGDYYALQPYDIVFLRPALLHKTEYPVRAMSHANAPSPRSSMVFQKNHWCENHTAPFQ